MSDLQVLFKVPEVIDLGLRTGALERVGGVIRDASTKQVVMWLRDSGVLEEGIKHVAEGVGSPANPINAVLNVSQTITTAVDGHFTRMAVNAVWEQVTQVSQQVAALASQTLIGNVVSLAFTAMALNRILRRIDNLSQQIDELIAQMNTQFERDRRIAFRAALMSARDVLEAERLETRQNALPEAVNGLTRAKMNLIEDFEAALKRAQTDERHLELAQHFLLQACYAISSIAQCYAQENETRLAAQRLREQLDELRPAAQKLIRAWLTSAPGFYLHPWMDRETMERALALQAWLRGERLNTRENKVHVVTEIVDELRADLWHNRAKFESRHPVIEFVSERRGAGTTRANLVRRYQRGVQESIRLVENIERLDGYELELRSMRLSMPEWSSLVDKTLLEQHGGALIVDSALLQHMEARLSRRPMRRLKP